MLILAIATCFGLALVAAEPGDIITPIDPPGPRPIPPVSDPINGNNGGLTGPSFGGLPRVPPTYDQFPHGIEIPRGFGQFPSNNWWNTAPGFPPGQLGGFGQKNLVRLPGRNSWLWQPQLEDIDEWEIESNFFSGNNPQMPKFIYVPIPLPYPVPIRTEQLPGPTGIPSQPSLPGTVNEPSVPWPVQPFPPQYFQGRPYPPQFFPDRPFPARPFPNERFPSPNWFFPPPPPPPPPPFPVQPQPPFPVQPQPPRPIPPPVGGPIIPDPPQPPKDRPLPVVFPNPQPIPPLVAIPVESD